MKADRKRIAILGSTGSIGTQTLDVVSAWPDLFEVSVLTARRNWQLAVRQALEYKPRVLVLAEEDAWRHASLELAGSGTEVLCGASEIAVQGAADDVDITLTALVGYSGLVPTLSAIEAGKTIALANKETLVAGGEIVKRVLASNPAARILPVDSEHSAIFQCLHGENATRMHRIILTASGGPFRTFSPEQLRHVTVEQALRNPNWDMGAKVTIDSASMMNKGFEMIEAHWLFDCPASKIDVVVHPQSVVHSMVEFEDGSVMAQLALPDMHLPIQYALAYPDRLPSVRAGRLNLADYGSLTFEAPDTNRFPLLALAYDALERGGNAPCVLNAANEVAVETFLRGEISFTLMPDLVAHTLHSVAHSPQVSLDILAQSDDEARRVARALLPKIKSQIKTS